MAGLDQLSYDLGYAGYRPDPPSRGNPITLQKQIREYVQSPDYKQRSAERSARKWLRKNNFKFESGDRLVRPTWSEESEKITTMVTDMFRIIIAQERAEYDQQRVKSEEQEHNPSIQLPTPPQLPSIPQASSHQTFDISDPPNVDDEEVCGPLERYFNNVKALAYADECRLERKDPQLIAQLTKQGHLILPEVFPTKVALIDSLKRWMSNNGSQMPPGASTFRGRKEPKYTTPLFFATTHLEVHAAKFGIQKNLGGWAITENGDIEQCGRCIYTLPSSGNGGVKRGYHAWLGEDRGFTEKPIAHAEGSENLRLPVVEESGILSENEAWYEDQRNRVKNTAPKRRTQIQSRRRSAHRLPTPVSADPTAEPVAQLSSSPTALCNPSMKRRNSNEPLPISYERPRKRLRSLSPQRPQQIPVNDIAEEQANQSRALIGPSSSLSVRQRIRDLSPTPYPVDHQDPSANASVDMPHTAGEIKHALSSVTHDLTMSIATAERLDAIVLKQSEALAESIALLKEVLPLAEATAQARKRAMFPHFENDIRTVQRTTSGREHLKSFYKTVQTDREALNEESVVSERIFTHAENLEEAPRTITEWAASAKAAHDLVDWMNYVNPVLDTASTGLQ